MKRWSRQFAPKKALASLQHLQFHVSICIRFTLVGTMCWHVPIQGVQFIDHHLSLEIL